MLLQVFHLMLFKRTKKFSSPWPDSHGVEYALVVVEVLDDPECDVWHGHAGEDEAPIGGGIAVAALATAGGRRHRGRPDRASVAMRSVAEYAEC